ILYGLLNSVLFSFLAFNTFNILLWKMNYFYLLCYYLKIKIISINNKIINSKRRINSKNINSIMKELNRLYVEINEYNTTYWSKFLLSVWLLFGSVIVILIYII